MAIVFQTNLSGIRLECDCKQGKLDIKFNFAGFKKLIAESIPVVSTDTDHERSGVESSPTFSFGYSTIYSHNLSSKIVTIKLYSRNIVRYRTLVASGQFDLHTLASGPSNFRLKMTPATSTGSIILSFKCTFTQLCPTFNLSVDSKVSVVVRSSVSIVPPLTMCTSSPLTTGTRVVEYKLPGAVDDLELYSIRFGTSKPISVMQDYDSTKIDQWMQVEGEDAKLKISQGPFYHQMSNDSLTDEKGVVKGRSVPGYPLPHRWSAPECVIGVWLPYPVSTTALITNLSADRASQVEQICQLIHEHYARLIERMLATPGTTNLESVKEIKRKLTRALVRVGGFHPPLTPRLKLE